MEDIARELEHRRRIAAIYTKSREDFEGKEDYDNYLEGVEDIIYKLTYNVDVAEVEQQVQDYVRAEAMRTGSAAAGAAAGGYAPPPSGTVLQPTPLVPVQQDAEGRLLPLQASSAFSREQRQAMAVASGWSQELITRRALQEAFSSLLLL